MWRGDFYVNQPILAYVGSVDAGPLQLEDLISNGYHLSGGVPFDPVTFQAVSLPFYAGNLSESQEIVPAGPIHTDNYPIIEFQAPVSHRNARAGQTDWFVGSKLINFFEQLQRATPADQDPYLSLLDPASRQFASAGLKYHQAVILQNLGYQEQAEAYFDDFIEILPVNVAFNSDGSGSTTVEE